jgi:hypothetical protein
MKADDSTAVTFKELQEVYIKKVSFCMLLKHIIQESGGTAPHIHNLRG